MAEEGPKRAFKRQKSARLRSKTYGLGARQLATAAAVPLCWASANLAFRLDGTCRVCCQSGLRQ
eukprot:7038283-Pyramimonas_sp.AAC.1